MGWSARVALVAVAMIVLLPLPSTCAPLSSSSAEDWAWGKCDRCAHSGSNGWHGTRAESNGTFDAFETLLTEGGLGLNRVLQAYVQMLVGELMGGVPGRKFDHYDEGDLQYSLDGDCFSEVAGDEDLLFQGWVDSNHFAIWNESIERLFPLLMQGRGNNATYPKLYSDLLKGVSASQRQFLRAYLDGAAGPARDVTIDGGGGFGYGFQLKCGEDVLLTMGGGLGSGLTLAGQMWGPRGRLVGAAVDAESGGGGGVQAFARDCVVTDDETYHLGGGAGCQRTKNATFFERNCHRAADAESRPRPFLALARDLRCHIAACAGWGQEEKQREGEREGERRGEGGWVRPGLTVEGGLGGGLGISKQRLVGSENATLFHFGGGFGTGFAFAITADQSETSMGKKEGKGKGKGKARRVGRVWFGCSGLTTSRPNLCSCGRRTASTATRGTAAPSPPPSWEGG